MNMNTVDFEKIIALIEDRSRLSIKAIAVVGSRLYKLDNEDSDYDYYLISDNNRISQQHISGDYDIRVTSMDLFIERIFGNSLPEIDLVYSRGLHFIDTNWKPIIDSFRYNPLAYYKNSYAFIHKFLPKINENFLDSPRQRKSIKSMLRYAILAERSKMLKEDFTPIFSKSEREQFYNDYEKILIEFQSIISIEDRLELLQNFSENFRSSDY